MKEDNMILITKNLVTLQEMLNDLFNNELKQHSSKEWRLIIYNYLQQIEIIIDGMLILAEDN